MSVRSGIVFGVREVRANVTVKQGLRGCGSQVCGQGIPDSSGAEEMVVTCHGMSQFHYKQESSRLSLQAV